MSKLDLALEDCLVRMDQEGESFEDCLSRYPEFAAELKPLLLAAHQVRDARQPNASPKFKSKLRSDLLAHAHSHQPQAGWRNTPTFRYAVSFAVLMLAMVTSGTALAQRALPGDILYSWKLGSESVWRSFQKNEVGVDLALVQRRLEELKAVKGHQELEVIGIQAYGNVLEHIGSQYSSNPQSVVAIQEQILNQRGLLEDLYDEEDLSSLDALFDAIANPNKPDHANPGQGINHGNPGRGWQKKLK